MKVFILVLSLVPFSLFASVDTECIDANDCQELTALPSEFNNPEVTGAQINNAFVMADEVLSDIGRSIAGEIEEE